MAAASQSAVVFQVAALPIVAFVIFVEIWQGVADIFDLDLWTDRSKVKGMHMHRVDEPGQSNLLELVMYEGANLLCQSFTIGT